MVTVDEITLSTGIALGTRSLGACPRVDTNRNRTVSISELVQAVRSALEGCDAGPDLSVVQILEDRIPAAAAVSPDHRHVYVVDATGFLAVLARDERGMLRPVDVLRQGEGGVEGLDGAQSIAISADGASVYVASDRDDAVVVFARDEETGRLHWVEALRDRTAGVRGLDGAHAIAISGDGRSVYVASTHSAVVSFARDRATGRLSFLEALECRFESSLGRCTGVDGLAGAYSVAISPDGQNVYVASGADLLADNNDGVAVLRRDQETGRLTFIEAERGGLASGVGVENVVALSPDGRNAYVANSAGLVVFSRNAQSGELTFVESMRCAPQPPSGVCSGADGLLNPRAVAVSPDGRTVYVTALGSIAVFQREQRTGQLSLVQVERNGPGGIEELWGANSIVISQDGDAVYVVSFDDVLVVFERTEETGELRLLALERDGLGGVDGLGGSRSVVVGSDGRSVYVASKFDDAVATLSRDKHAGTLTLIDSDPVAHAGRRGVGAQAVAVSRDGRTVYAATPNELAAFRRDEGTGELSFEQVVREQWSFVGGISIAVSDDGTSLYVADDLRNSVHVLSRHAQTGHLDFLQVVRDGERGVDGLAGARSVVISPDERSIYVASVHDNALTRFTREESGQLTFAGLWRDGVAGVEGLGAASGVAISADGQSVYVASQRRSSVALFARDGQTGELGFADAWHDIFQGVRGLGEAQALAISADGTHLYVAGPGRVAILVRDRRTGSLRVGRVVRLPGLFVGSGGVSVAVSSDGHHVYQASEFNGLAVLAVKNETQ